MMNYCLIYRLVCNFKKKMDPTPSHPSHPSHPGKSNKGKGPGTQQPQVLEESKGKEAFKTILPLIGL